MNHPQGPDSPHVRCWNFVVHADEVPGGLRAVADRLETSGATLLGLWSTGFGEQHEAVLQVLVDLEAPNEGTCHD